MCQQLLDTTFGENSLSLDEAVNDLAGRFLLGGVMKLTDAHRVHIAVLVRHPPRISYDYITVTVNSRDDLQERIRGQSITMTII